MRSESGIFLFYSNDKYITYSSESSYLMVKKIMNSRSNSFSLDMQEFKSGVYYILIEKDNERITIKTLINNR